MYNAATGEFEIEKRYSVSFPANLGDTLAPVTGLADEYATSTLSGGAKWLARLLSYVTPDGYGTWDVKGIGAKFEAYKMDPELRKIANDLKLSDTLYSISADQARAFLNHAAQLPNFTTTYGTTEQILQNLSEKYDQSFRP
jgi:hypothetical protein